MTDSLPPAFGAAGFSAIGEIILDVATAMRAHGAGGDATAEAEVCANVLSPCEAHLIYAG